MTVTREEELAALIADQEADAQSIGRYDARTRFRRNGSSTFVELDRSIGETGSATIGDLVGRQDEQLHEFLGGDDTKIRRIARPQKWTRRQIVSHIKKWVAEHGELPYYADWNHPNGRGIPSAASVVRKFGSWSAGIRAAGFEPRKVGGPRNLNPGHEKARQRVKQRRCSARLSVDQLAAAYVLYQGGLSINELARRLYQRCGYSAPHLCAQAIRQGFHADGYRVRSKSEARLALAPETGRAVIRAMNESRKKLTSEQVQEIRSSREMQKVLAERYGVSQSTISRLRRCVVPVYDDVAA